MAKYVTILPNPNNKKVFADLDARKGKIEKALKTTFTKTGRYNKNYAKKLLELPKFGNKYQILPNRSSAPGEAPANQSGSLSRSIDFSVTKNRMEFGDKPRAGFHNVSHVLEFGGDTTIPMLGNIEVKIEARPHISKTAEDCDEKVMPLMVAELKKIDKKK